MENEESDLIWMSAWLSCEMMIDDCEREERMERERAIKGYHLCT